MASKAPRPNDSDLLIFLDGLRTDLVNVVATLGRARGTPEIDKAVDSAVQTLVRADNKILYTAAWVAAAKGGAA